MGIRVKKVPPQTNISVNYDNIRRRVQSSLGQQEQNSSIHDLDQTPINTLNKVSFIKQKPRIPKQDIFTSRKQP